MNKGSGVSSPASAAPAAIASFSLQVAVRTLWQEARGEPPVGQRAVAHAIVNRLHSGRWGHCLAEVCLSPLQFSGWNATDPNRIVAARLADDAPELLVLGGLLLAVLDGSDADLTDGATHYYAPKLAKPAWAKSMTACGQFGNQLFFKPKV